AMSAATIQPGRRAITATPHLQGTGLPPPPPPRKRGDGGLFRHQRKQLKPWGMMGGLFAAAVAAQVAVAATGAASVIAAMISAAALVAAIIGASRRRGRRGAVHWVATLAAAGGWLAWTTLAGLTFASVLAMVAGGCLLSLRHWRQHRIPVPGERTPTVEPVEEDENFGPTMLWAQYIGSNNGALPGSYLSNETDTPTGVRYDLHLVPGTQSIETARGVLPRLRTGLHVTPGQDLIMEAHPTLSEAVVQLTLVRRSPLLDPEKSVAWPGPTYNRETGDLDLGPYVDGDGMARWKLISDNRLYGGFLSGATGSGKSLMMASLALAAAGEGGVIWYIDPQRGASYPWLADRADWTARSEAEALVMLQAARRVKELRQDYLALHGGEGYQSSSDKPELLIVIDECHRVFRDERAQGLADEIAREGGKCGAAIVAASQVATLDVFGPQKGQDSLRSSLAATNIVVLRTKSANTARVLPGVDVDPTKFPRIPGYAYLVDDTGKRRNAPFRGYYLTNQARDEWESQITWRSLDPASAQAAGPDYVRRQEKAQQALAAIAARIAAAEEGRAIPSTPSSSRPQPNPPAVAAGAPIPTNPFNGGAVLQFPSVRDTVKWDTQPDAVGTPARNTTTARDVVFGLICRGFNETGELITRSGYSPTQVRRTLDALVDDKAIVRDRHGVWVRAS
ncbi:MAG: hypothetical protein ACRD0P_14250, partial [Stackebrandtia sp.]